jgi:hypothetical protein
MESADTTRRILQPLQEWSSPMRAIVKTSVMALTAAVVLGSVVYGQGTVPQQRSVDGSAPAPAMSARLPVEIGDKLKISFYETIDMAATKQ